MASSRQLRREVLPARFRESCFRFAGVIRQQDDDRVLVSVSRECALQQFRPLDIVAGYSLVPEVGGNHVGVGLVGMVRVRGEDIPQKLGWVFLHGALKTCAYLAQIHTTTTRRYVEVGFNTQQ